MPHIASYYSIEIFKHWCVFFSFSPINNCSECNFNILMQKKHIVVVERSLHIGPLCWTEQLLNKQKFTYLSNVIYLKLPIPKKKKEKNLQFEAYTYQSLNITSLKWIIKHKLCLQMILFQFLNNYNLVLKIQSLSENISVTD